MQFLFPLLVLTTSLQGAPKVKAQATVVPEKARPGERVELQVNLEIQKGWHIYAPNFKGIGIPTKLVLKPGPY